MLSIVGLRTAGYWIALVALGCSGSSPPYLTELEDARGLAGDLRLHFGKASGASNRAVMADTDEASVLFAREAETAVQVVERDVGALNPLLKHLHFTEEARALAAFEQHFAEYRNTDRKLLELAVENTNLKAQRLSFGPVGQAADGFRDSVVAVAAAVPSKDRCQADELAAKATLAIREIQVLQAPHIAEAEDGVMTRIEKEMDFRSASAKEALNALRELSPANASAASTAATAALDRFEKLSRETIELSRRNTNVRSLDLALRTEPALAAACDDNLRVLQESLAKKGFKATR